MFRRLVITVATMLAMAFVPGLLAESAQAGRGGGGARLGGEVLLKLLQAAADQWKVPVEEVTVADGVITHAASKRSAGHGSHAAAATRGTG